MLVALQQTARCFKLLVYQSHILANNISLQSVVFAMTFASLHVLISLFIMLTVCNAAAGTSKKPRSVTVVRVGGMVTFQAGAGTYLIWKINGKVFVESS